ncbi:hypothetical protein SLS62_001690 [Diatrype stigma]|uniref:Carboxylic ester hydrolase n=1 Tax=Diatrype stigma TaxID=117547 RepID=A0AAN9V8E6_9PEZI
MKLSPLSELITVATLFSSCSAELAAGTARRDTWTVGQTVQTTSGPVEGQEASSSDGVSEYLGIPYAAPPVGERRWLPPANYSGDSTIKATSFGPGCLENPGSAVSRTANADSPHLTDQGLYILGQMLDPIADTSEDCLTLNVWTKPQVGEEKKAVMMFIHGGSFVSGSSRIAAYNGQHLAERQDVVLVTINYRLNIWGFPGAPNQTQNLGLRDQRLALEWVRDNIAAFGGDVDRITVFGESAGAGSVDVMSYAYTDDPIAAGYIAESGTAAQFATAAQAAEASQWYSVSSKVGCGDALAGADAVFACMQGVDAETIKAALPVTGLSQAFAPVVDDEVVFSDYVLRSPAAVPLLIGTNDKESDLFKYTLAENYSDTFYAQAELLLFDCPVASRADKGIAAGNPTWRYRWMGVFPNTVLAYVPMSGAWHGSEVCS